MSVDLRKVTPVRPWLFALVLGLMVFSTACNSRDECTHESPNYPECLGEGPTG
jgi:hypothetical protein